MSKFIGPQELKQKQMSVETQYNKNKVSIKNLKSELSFDHEYYINPILIVEYMDKFKMPFFEDTYQQDFLIDKNYFLLEVISIMLKPTILEALTKKNVPDTTNEITKIIYLSLVNI